MEVNHASKIDEIFDTISYKKGASIIQMLKGYVGGPRFQVAKYWNLILILFISFISNLELIHLIS